MIFPKILLDFLYSQLQFESNGLSLINIMRTDMVTLNYNSSSSSNVDGTEIDFDLSLDPDRYMYLRFTSRLAQNA